MFHVEHLQNAVIMKSIDILLLVCVAGLVLIPFYMVAGDPSPKTPLALVWVGLAAVCFAILFWETFKKR